MKARKEILGDTGKQCPGKLGPGLARGQRPCWLAVNGRHSGSPRRALRRDAEQIMQRPAAPDCSRRRTPAPSSSMASPAPRNISATPMASAIPISKARSAECVPGQGKLTADGNWVALATGEFLLGYADEAGELPVAPVPHLLGRNGTLHGVPQAAPERRNIPRLPGRKGPTLRRRQGKARRQVRRPLARRHAASSFRRTPRPRLDRRSRTAIRTSPYGARSRRRPLPDRRAHPPRPSARRLRLSRRAGQPPPHHAPRSALRRVRARRPAGERHRRTRHHFHGR